MSKKVEFKAFLPVTTDIVGFWESVVDKKRCHLGGENSRYTISYRGPIEEGLNIIEQILQLDDYEILFKATKGG